MNNRYLYKAKRKHDSKFFKKGEWVEGSYYIEPYNDKCFIIQWNSTGLGFNEFIEVDEESVCQCTGLKDKNGNLIWENDVVEVKNDKHHFISQIEWDNFCKGFMFQDTKTTACGMDAISDSGCYRFGCEVIGNIFDNPELMYE